MVGIVLEGLPSWPWCNNDLLKTLSSREAPIEPGDLYGQKKVSLSEKGSMEECTVGKRALDQETENQVNFLLPALWS